MTVRVGLELTVLELDAGGTARAARGLADALVAREDVELVALGQGGWVRGRIARGLVRELAWLPFGLPARARRAGLDVLHCPGPNVPLRTGAMPLVVTVHDDVAWAHPEWMSRANVLQHRLVLGRTLPRAAAVITPSAFARDTVLARLELDPARVHVVPWGVDARFSPGPEPTDGPREGGFPYLLAVGTLQPRKNLEAALAAFERAVDAGLEHRLVIAGARGWRDTTLVERVQGSRHAGRIRLAGFVADHELVALYRGADALLFPSRHEGFGLPALEAMACGTPVVAARAGALPEVVGDAGVLVGPDDHDAWAGALLELVGDADRRAVLGAAGLRRAAGFTWTACADRTVAAYRAAAAGG
jgi:glycosyltransferase involved in cell wall biosynthesis